MAATDRFLFRLLVAVRLSRVGEDRGAGREARPQRRLASDPARRRLQADRRGAADAGAAQGRLLEARLRAQRALSRRRGFRMPSKFPIPTQAPARIVLWLQATRSRRSRPRVAARALPRILRRRHRHLGSRRAAAIAAAMRRRRGRGARGDRRSGDQGRAEARRRRGDRARRLRLAVRHRRRRAVLGHRPLRPGRALARDRRLVS